MQKEPSDAELLVVSAQFVKDMKGLQAVQTWEHVDDKPVLLSKIERQGRVVAKGQITIELAFDTLAEFFSDPTYPKKLTDMLTKADVLYKGPGFDVVQFHMKGFGEIAAREMVVVFTFHRQGDKIYVGNRSCQYIVPAAENIIRAFTHCAGSVVQKIDEKNTRITHFGDIDMNDIDGSIPESIKKQIALMKATALSQLEQKVRATLK